MSETCKARAQGTAGGNDPQDCDWPFCGCDPHAERVLAALDESGLTLVRQDVLRQIREAMEDLLPEAEYSARMGGAHWVREAAAKAAEAGRAALSELRRLNLKEGK